MPPPRHLTKFTTYVTLLASFRDPEGYKQGNYYNSQPITTHILLEGVPASQEMRGEALVLDPAYLIRCAAVKGTNCIPPWV